MVSTTIGNILIGMTFLRKYSATLETSKHPVHSSDFSPQLKHAKGQFKGKMGKLSAAQKVVVAPFQQINIPTSTNEEQRTSQRLIEANPTITRKAAPFVTLAIMSFENKRTIIQITNPSDHTHIINPVALFSNFSVLTPNQTKRAKPMPLEKFSLITQFLEDAPQLINQLFDEPTYTEQINDTQRRTHALILTPQYA